MEKYEYKKLTKKEHDEYIAECLKKGDKEEFLAKLKFIFQLYGIFIGVSFIFFIICCSFKIAVVSIICLTLCALSIITAFWIPGFLAEYFSNFNNFMMYNIIFKIIGIGLTILWLIWINKNLFPILFEWGKY